MESLNQVRDRIAAEIIEQKTQAMEMKQAQAYEAMAQIQMGWVEREKELTRQHSINDPGHCHNYVEAPIALHGHPVVEVKQHGLDHSVSDSLQNVLRYKMDQLKVAMDTKVVGSLDSNVNPLATQKVVKSDPNDAMIARDGRSSATRAPSPAVAKTTVKRALPSLAAFSVVAPQGSSASPAMLKAFSALSEEQDEATRTSRPLAAPFRA